MQKRDFRPASPGFNDSMKNVEERTGARYELQRNFKGSDSPGGTDLSARLSFAKRAREVKAANEAAVFKEDYPRDDKSIEDDERPNRSRVSEASRTHRKSTLNGEKCGKEINRRDIGTLYITDENCQNPNKHQDESINNNVNVDCGPRNIIRRKRISRGVQYDVSIGRRSRIAFRFLLKCFRSNREKYNSAREVKKSDILNNTKSLKIVSSQDGANTSLIKEMSSDDCRFEECHTVSDNKMEKLLNDTDLKTEMLESNEEATRKIKNDNSDKQEEEEEEEDHPKNNHITKKNSLKKFIRILTRNPRMEQNQSQRVPNTDDFLSNKSKKTVDSVSENNRTSRNHKRDNHGTSIKSFYREASSNARRSAHANSDDESDVNKARRRLDFCIAELSEIISDACVIFGSGDGAARESGRQTCDASRRVTLASAE